MGFGSLFTFFLELSPVGKIPSKRREACSAASTLLQIYSYSSADFFEMKRKGGALNGHLRVFVTFIESHCLGVMVQVTHLDHVLFLIEWNRNQKSRTVRQIGNMC